MGRDSVERQRKVRLLQMVEVARVYRGCSKNELASMLDRDPAKIVPESGNPKLDLVVGLADALSWSVSDVVEAIWGREPEVEPPTEAFDALNLAAVAAHRDGEFGRMITLGRQMLSVAKDARERASAAWRIAGGYEAQGLYVRALEWMQAASRESGLPAPSARVILANLAACHYSLGNLREAFALARDVATELLGLSSEDRRDRSAAALARYVEGNCLRRRMAAEEEERSALGARAEAALEASRALFSSMSRDYDDAAYAGIANTCGGALLEVRVLLGHQEPAHAIQQVLAGIESIGDVETAPRGDWLESWGWWAVFGCNIAQRHLHGDERERALAILTNKASEIAERQGNWCLREQIFTVEFIQRIESHAMAGEAPANWVLDADDLRNLVGAMGRFPRFRGTGWRILSAASIVGMQGGVT